MWWYRQLLLKVFFRDILRMICNIDFECDCINFQKQKKLPLTYQCLDISPLNWLFWFHSIRRNLTLNFLINIWNCKIDFVKNLISSYDQGNFMKHYRKIWPKNIGQTFMMFYVLHMIFFTDTEIVTPQYWE